MRIKLGLSLLGACALLLALGATALACVLSTPAPLSPTSAGPGDQVTFSISGVEYGATYELQIDGGVVKSGANTNINQNGVSGTFPMPNLGNEPRDVDVFPIVHHEQDYDLSPWTIHYVPASATPVSTEVPSNSSVVSKGTSTSRVLPHPAGRDQTRATGATANVSRDVPEVTSIETGAGDPPLRPVAHDSTAKQHSGHESASVSHRVLDAVGGTTKVGSADIPTAGLLLMALIFIAGTGVAAFTIYLLQHGPDPKAALKAPAPLGHDPIEVELQEMIAEEMARSLIADLALGEPTLNSP